MRRTTPIIDDMHDERIDEQSQEQVVRTSLTAAMDPQHPLSTMPPWTDPAAGWSALRHTVQVATLPAAYELA